MKRVIVALAAIIGLSENAPESTQKQTSHISALHQREPLFNISRPTLPHQDKEYALQQDELELQCLDAEIELTALSLYHLKECEDEDNILIDQNRLHQEIRILAMDIHYSLLEHNVGYAARATAQARYVERCLEKGYGLLELYQAHFHAIEKEDYHHALQIAKEIGNAALEFETQQMMSSTFPFYREETTVLEKLVLRMSDAELEESARYVAPSSASAWIEGCIENKVSHHFFSYDFGDAERSCLAALVRADNFALFPYDVEDSLRGMRLYSFQDLEIKCQLETYLFLFGGNIPRLSLSMYEYRDECMAQNTLELKFF
ncbi:MAG: hypothetical protein Q7K45_06985 [Nanoarchaeota archaeon]|nr:hypothetical protein [Nanoarchaeota archaeon]